MASYDLHVSVAGVPVITRRLATAKTLFTDFKAVWPSVEAWFYAMEKEQFATEGHGQWPQLAPSTVRKRGSAHPILGRGPLYESLTNPGSPGAIRVKTNTTITLGTSLSVNGWNLGLLHQTGTGRKARTHSKSGKALKHPVFTFRMPPRPPIDPNWKQKTQLIAAFAKYVHQVVTGESGGH